MSVDMASNKETSLGSAHAYLSATDLSEIDKRFESVLQEGECLVFWTGVSRPMVQQWADKKQLKTLTSAMGPLMDQQNPESPRHRLGDKQWSKYMKGASSRFAEYACRSRRAVVVTNPPPDIYSTREGSTYRNVEEPILKGIVGGKGVISISYVHPTVGGAEDFQYQAWPLDKSSDWIRYLQKTCDKIMTIHAVFGNRSKARLTQIKDDLPVQAHMHSVEEQQRRPQEQQNADRGKMEKEQRKSEKKQRKARKKKEMKRMKAEEEQRKAQQKEEAKRKRVQEDQRKVQTTKQVDRKIVEEKQQKAQEEKKAIQRRMEEEKKRIQQKAQESKKAIQKRMEEEKKRLQQKAQGEKKAIQRRIEEEKKTIQQKAQQKAQQKEANRKKMGEEKKRVQQKVQEEKKAKKERMEEEEKKKRTQQKAQKKEAHRKKMEEDQRIAQEKKEAKQKKPAEAEEAKRKKKREKQAAQVIGSNVSTV